MALQADLFVAPMLVITRLFVAVFGGVPPVNDAGVVVQRELPWLPFLNFAEACRINQCLTQAVNC